MALQTSDDLAHAQLDQIETILGASPLLEIFTGSQPASCAAADSGTKLMSATLPADHMATATGRAKAKAGTWSGTGLAAGNAGYWRLKTSGGVTKLQGSVTATGGGGQLTLDNINIALNQVVTISSFSIADNNG